MTIVDQSPYINARSAARLGQAIRGLRSQRGMTQAQLAQRARVSRQWLSYVERGRKKGLEISLIMQVLDALDASLAIRDDWPTDSR